MVTLVEYGDQTWAMPSGASAFQAALAIHAGVDVERNLEALGGVLLVASEDGHEEMSDTFG